MPRIWRLRMKLFEVSFKRIESVRFDIEGKNKKEIKKIIDNSEWDLDSEKVDEVENKCFKIKETEI